MLIFWAVLGGFLLDALFGDPVWLPHPVVLMGRCISALEKRLRTALPKTQRGERGHLENLGHNLVVDNCGIIEVPAALNDTMTNAINRKVGLLKLLEHASDSRAMIGERDLLGLLGATVLGVAKDAHVRTDTFAVALGENLAGIGIQKLIFKA